MLGVIVIRINWSNVLVRVIPWMICSAFFASILYVAAVLLDIEKTNVLGYYMISATLIYTVSHNFGSEDGKDG